MPVEVWPSIPSEHSSGKFCGCHMAIDFVLHTVALSGNVIIHMGGLIYQR